VTTKWHKADAPEKVIRIMADFFESHQTKVLGVDTLFVSVARDANYDGWIRTWTVDTQDRPSTAIANVDSMKLRTDDFNYPYVIHARGKYYLVGMKATNAGWVYSFELPPGIPESSGWDHSIMGVDPPASVIGILRENIKSVLGVE
jgi:hypothetical protein